MFYESSTSIFIMIYLKVLTFYHRESPNDAPDYPSLSKCTVCLRDDES